LKHTLQKNRKEKPASTLTTIVNITNAKRNLKNNFMKTLNLLLTAAFFSLPLLSEAQSKSDSLAIKQAALDYIEGWYEGDSIRMENALHPELAKRNVQTNKNGESHLTQMSALTLINYTKVGYGKNTPKNKQQKEVIILDIFQNAASVKIIATDWIDYLHVVKWEGKWKIINVYWENKPKENK
jgi:hypothetical protein